MLSSFQDVQKSWGLWMDKPWDSSCPIDWYALLTDNNGLCFTTAKGKKGKEKGKKKKKERKAEHNTPPPPF